jgi:hypothetical protein
MVFFWLFLMVWGTLGLVFADCAGLGFLSAGLLQFLLVWAVWARLWQFGLSSKLWQFGLSSKLWQFGLRCGSLGWFLTVMAGLWQFGLGYCSLGYFVVVLVGCDSLDCVVALWAGMLQFSL